MKTHLEITIPDHNSFYTLFSDGVPAWKTYDRRKKTSLFYYPPGAVVFLYYTYPTRREACVIRNSVKDKGVMLPGLSKKVTLLFNVAASRVDKLKRAASWLKVHSSGAFSHNDGFYVRLFYILQRRGKINYPALNNLLKKTKEPKL
jgi:hypothetical protein